MTYILLFEVGLQCLMARKEQGASAHPRFEWRILQYFQMGDLMLGGGFV